MNLTLGNSLMFSFKKNIELLDHQERRFQTAVNCYLAAILSIQEHAIELTPELTHEHQLASGFFTAPLLRTSPPNLLRRAFTSSSKSW